ncbi:acyl-CoA carboxylase epsilon subunit [Kitasatospora kifunensis]|uniref:Acyl-CoA carboxylase subunit epsilon n=1 Tax=Kitasatospora kifunensis TaxID=58351 RepID=A0A7W7R3Q3_KITKI|nr:acyl-CoA carboxylase epsilon subunit [Kitasatospora kifunensis]MBB4924857.1 hypothetical protein [Kitasatospora kifunensis]
MTAREQADRLDGAGTPDPGPHRPAPACPAGARCEVLRIERGRLTDEELAAVAAVLLARLAGARRPALAATAHRVTPGRCDYRSPVSWLQAA